MDYPKISNETVTVILNDYSRYILETYDIPDVSSMINKAIEFYFTNDYYHYERRKKTVLTNTRLNNQ